MRVEYLFNRMLRPIAIRIRTMIRRAVIERIDDSSKFQAVQVSLMDGEVRDDVEHFQAYGLAVHPHKGAEALHVKVAGTHGVVICAGDRRYRLTGLEEGEVALFDDLGSTVWFKRSGDIEITANAAVKALDSAGSMVHLKNDGNAVITGSTVHMGGDPAADFVALSAKVATELSSIISQVNALVTSYNGHSHVLAASGVDTVTGAPVTVTGTASAPPAPAGVPVTAAGSVASTVAKAT